MARLAGFEPTTPSFGGLYAIHLRHSRVELSMIPWASEKPKHNTCTAKHPVDEYAKRFPGNSPFP